MAPGAELTQALKKDMEPEYKATQIDEKGLKLGSKEQWNRGTVGIV